MPALPPVTRENIIKGLIISAIEAAIILALCVHFS
jgi:hypothetical protein